MPMHPYLALTILLALCGVWPAHAATFCADTLPEIVAAMDAAKANGEDDDIRIVAGTYLLDETLRLGNIETESRALSFSGRWNADCSQASAGGASTLSGRNARQILALSLPEDIDLVIEDLAFTSGFAAFNATGGVLDISGARTILIDRIQVYANVMENGDAPLSIATGGTGAVLTVRNSLLFDNEAHETTGMRLSSLQGEVNVVGNTITANTSSIPCPCSGLNYAGSSAYTISNNLVWGNEGGDVRINPLDAIHLHNDIGQLAAGSNPPGSGSSGDVSIDPMFDADGVHLLPESALIDAGISSAPGGIGDLDGARGPRVTGSSVDIGAFEFAGDLIFRDGFDGLPLP